MMLEIDIKSFWYKVSDPPVVYDCTFTVGHCEFVAVVGESGGGKTTLLRLCCGLLQSQMKGNPGSPLRLDGGVKYHGSLVETPDEAFSYVPQEFHLGLHPMKTALANVLLAVWYAGTSTSEKADAAKLLETSGIIDIAHLRVGKLSGGQQQRVAICRALIKQPKILFMDEPFANLDPTLRPSMTVLLKELRTQYDLSLLVVTHDIEGALRLADKIVGMKQTYGIPIYRSWPTEDSDTNEARRNKLRKEIEEWMGVD